MPVTQFPTASQSIPLPPVLTDPALEPTTRLQLVLDAEKRAREEWEEIQRIADDIDPETNPDLLEQARKDIRNAYRRWFEISDQAVSLAEKTRRAKLELPRTHQYQTEYENLLIQFKEHYQEGGPQYDLLCERVAGLSIRLKQMEESGRDFSPTEYQQTNTSLLSFVNQLQRFTEATKQESISKETQAVAETLLQIMERHVSTTYPELWTRIVADVRRAMEGVAA